MSTATEIKTARNGQAMPASSSIHFTLQGKGGVGKSLVSAMLAQYLGRAGATVRCIDTDPVNQTLQGYRALKTEHLALRENGSSRVNERKFDDLMQILLQEKGTFVIDNGAASFLPLSSYLLENDALQMLSDAGRDVFIHVVITGGQSLGDTLAGFEALASNSQGQNIVVWLNEFFGPIEDEVDGKRVVFTDMDVFKANADKVRGLVTIRARNADTFGRDIHELAASRLTFDEGIRGDHFTLVAKQRLKIVQRELYAQLDEVGFAA